MIKLEKFVHEQQFQSINTEAAASAIAGRAAKISAAKEEKGFNPDIKENLTNGVPNLFPIGKKVVEEDVTANTGLDPGTAGDSGSDLGSPTEAGNEP